jgi:DNA (cytosine-5)-methyltransferase 1
VGAGGAHLGFKNAGFESVLVNDIDPDTIKTLIQNNVVREDQCLTCPIEEITEGQLKGLNPDVLFGGIVCKGFSMAGVRNPFDVRNYLYKHQLRLVSILKPKVSVIENVTAIKNMILYRECDETVNTFREYTQLSDLNKNLNGEKSSKRKSNESYADLNTTINENKKKMDELLKNIALTTKLSMTADDKFSGVDKISFVSLSYRQGDRGSYYMEVVELYEKIAGLDFAGSGMCVDILLPKVYPCKKELLKSVLRRKLSAVIVL